MQEAFEEEKQRAVQEIERLKAELEENRKASLAEIEADRKRVEEDLARKKDEAERVVEVQKEAEQGRTAKDCRRPLRKRSSSVRPRRLNGSRPSCEGEPQEDQQLAAGLSRTSRGQGG